MGDNSKPVFHDPNGQRAKRVNLVAATLAVGALAIFAAVEIGSNYAPALPEVAWASKHTVLDSAVDRTAETATSEGFIAGRNRQVPASAASAMRMAFFSANDPSSLIALRRHADQLDAIIPDWLRFAPTESGIAPQDRVREARVRTWLSQHAPHVRIYPSIDDSMPAAKVAGLLATSAARTRLVQAIEDYLRSYGYAGITLSLSNLPASSHANLATFLSQLRAKLNADGRKVILALDTSDASPRMQVLADASDYILLSTFTGPARQRPGPIVPQGWLETQLAAPFVAINRAKLIVGLGSYGYDWDSIGRKKDIAVQTAWDAMRGAKAHLSFSSPSLNSNFSYTDNGKQHEVWFLDAASVFNQARSALATRPAGVAVWRLGLEDPGIWSFLGRGQIPDKSALAALRKPEPGNDIYTRAEGDFLEFKAAATNGERNVSYNDGLGLIVAQSFASLPKQAVLSTPAIADKKLIGLTFDDGPDPRYTPAILDLLAAKGAKATFFVVGKNAIAYPALLQRILDEGHDIGNHTYAHSDLLDIRDGAVESELNGAQRVLESRIGRHTIFFRPPYASRHLLHEPEAPRVIERAAKLGYLTISAAVDPFDWMGPTSAQIAARVLEQIKDETGQVVLLHDSGGNRKPTIEALPRIIDTLQAGGYELAPLHRLLGKTRDEVMPVVETAGAASFVGQSIRTVWYGILQALYAATPIVVITATALGALRLCLILIGAHVQERRERRRHRDTNWRPASVAVLVPAYNEAKVVCHTVEALLASTLDMDFDVVVVDDGSKDDTAGIVRRAFASDSRVKVFEKPNGGKASALNFGLRCTDAEVVVAIDADTVLDRDAIGYLVRHFGDPSIGAVAGSAMVGNRINLLTRLQAIEYATSQNLDRRAFELFNAISVVPGAIGAWRREAVLQVGGYASDTLAEDADVTIALERHGWKVIYEPRAIARTEAPETLRAFLKQRYRWLFGTLQVAHKNAGAILRNGPLSLALITLPNIYLFQFAFALIAPFMDALLVWSVFSVASDSIRAERYEPLNSLFPIAMYWAIFQLFDIGAAIAALRMDVTRSWSLLPLIIVQRFCYRQLLYVVALRSVAAAVKGHFVGWGKLARTGSAQVNPAS